MTTPMTVLKPVLVVLLVLALLLSLAILAQRRLIYLPDRSEVAPATDYLPAGQDLTLQTSDGLSLTAWHVPAGAADRQLTILVAPGNAGNRSSRAPLAQLLADHGFGVLLLEYRGYGGNPGRPTEAGLARDARAAYDHLVGPLGVPPEQLIYFGESLGNGVITELATEHPPAGLVLRSPFVDLAEVGATHYPFLPVRTVLWDRYPVAERVAQLDLPTAVIYGARDTIVPPAQSRKVADAAAGPVEVTAIPGADHNDAALFTGDQLVAAVVALAEQLPPR